MLLPPEPQLCRYRLIGEAVHISPLIILEIEKHLYHLLTQNVFYLSVCVELCGGGGDEDDAETSHSPINCGLL